MSCPSVEVRCPRVQVVGGPRPKAETPVEQRARSRGRHLVACNPRSLTMEPRSGGRPVVPMVVVRGCVVRCLQVTRLRGGDLRGNCCPNQLPPCHAATLTRAAKISTSHRREFNVDLQTLCQIEFGSNTSRH